MIIDLDLDVAIAVLKVSPWLSFKISGLGPVIFVIPIEVQLKEEFSQILSQKAVVWFVFKEDGQNVVNPSRDVNR